MTTTQAPPQATTLSKPRPEISVRGRRIPVVLPKWSDPRLKLSATIWALTILGLTILRFQVSIPQIVVTVLLCGLIEVIYSYLRDHLLVWPASALQTGISVAFILRVAGVKHGEIWSVRGIQWFVLLALMSMLPKYLIRRDGRHVFNPSNIALAWGLLLIGPSQVFSEHLWWAPLGWRSLLAFAVILGGAYWVLRQVNMVALATAFIGAFLPLVGLCAMFGRSYYARWHNGPVGGSFYWVTVALSPEVLIFAFFMITDPQTAPRSRTGRIIHAVATATIAATLISLQTTEFAIKVSILSSLVVTSALVPTIERLAGRIDARRAGLPAPKPQLPLLRRIAAGARQPVLVVILVIAIAASLNTALLSRDHRIQLIERGLVSHAVQ